MIWRISLWYTPYEEAQKRPSHLFQRQNSRMWESPAPNSEGKGMLPSADFPQEGSKDVCTTTHQTTSLPLPIPANSVTSSVKRKGHKPSPVAEHTLGHDLVSPPWPQDLQSYKVPHKNITCFQPLANIIKTVSKSCYFSAAQRNIWKTYHPWEARE